MTSEAISISINISLYQNMSSTQSVNLYIRPRVILNGLVTKTIYRIFYRTLIINTIFYSSYLFIYINVHLIVIYASKLFHLWLGKPYSIYILGDLNVEPLLQIDINQT